MARPTDGRRNGVEHPLTCLATMCGTAPTWGGSREPIGVDRLAFPEPAPNPQSTPRTPFGSRNPGFWPKTCLESRSNSLFLRISLAKISIWRRLFARMSQPNTPQTPNEADFFRQPGLPAQRQYEALRAYVLDDLPAAEAAQRFGYTPATLYSLAKQWRAGQLRFFQEAKPGPKHAPKRSAVHHRVVELRKQNYSIYDICQILAAEGTQVSHVLIHQILGAEGFAKLPRRRDEERPSILRPEPAEIADIRELDWRKFSRFETEGGGLFVFLPQLMAWELPRRVREAGLPGSEMIPALQSVLSMLALKLTGKERLSHVMDVCSDPGFALFAGLNVLPKTTALSTYSYRIEPNMTLALLRAHFQTLGRLELLPGKSVNLDFHVIPHRGEHAVLEKNYLSRRSRSERSVLAFFAQDNDSRLLCHANATVRKDQAAQEILRFLDFWRENRSDPPPQLVFDSQLTTYAVLAELDRQDVRFITLRRRGPALMRALQQLEPAAWRPLRLEGVSRRFTKARFIEQEIQPRPLPNPLRQIAVRGLGHDQPTLFLSNDFDISPKALVERYARRMLIENAFAESIDFFHLDALCSAIAIQVDFDVLLTLLASALYRQLARRLQGFENAQPAQIFRHFLNTPARVSVDEHEVHVRLRRCAHHPLLLASGALGEQPSVPWWGGRRLTIEIR